MKKKSEKTAESESNFAVLRRKVRDALYDLSCWFYRKKQTKKAYKKQKVLHRSVLQRNIFLTCVLIVPLSNFFIYYIVVNFNSILMAFQTYNLSEGKYVFLNEENGGLFANFSAFIKDMQSSFFLKFAHKNSFMLYFISLLISMPIQIFTSFFIYKKIPGAGFFKVVLYLPQIISGIIMTIIFRYFADGAIPELVKRLGYPKPNLFSVNNAFKTIIVYNIWFGMGGGMIIYTGAMSRIPDDIVEYGLLEGLTMVKEFFYVTLPLIFPTVSVYLITGVSGIFTNQGSIYNFYGESADASLYTYGYFLFVQVIGENASLSQYPYASAAGLLFTLVAATITLLVKYLLERFGPNAEF